MKKLFWLFLLVHLMNFSFSQDRKKLSPTPPMGWNSWNWFSKGGMNEENMKQCMDALVKNGLLEAGYEYFVIDGGWRDKNLSGDGKLLAHPKKFPNGIKPLADYAHSLGLKFGLHTVPGTHDCGGDAVGGMGHEDIHVQQFIDWGIDFIKLDMCRNSNGWDHFRIKDSYEKYYRLLEKNKSEIILSISAYEWRSWYPEFGQMARTTDDIRAKVSGGAVFDNDPRSVLGIAEENNKWANYAGNGYWNDPDFLAIGNQGLNIDEQKIHFALWCIMSAPLFLGNDPRNMTEEELSIITNKMAINVNQDPTEQGKRIKKLWKTEVWAKQLENGDVAVLMLNKGKETQKITLLFSDIGIDTKASITDIYTQKKLGEFDDRYSSVVGDGKGLFVLLAQKT